MEKDKQQMKQRKIAVFVFGRPGSGKGTQSRILADHFGFVLSTVSNLIRAAFERGEHLEYKKPFDDGLLLPKDWIIELMLVKIQETAQQERGIVFDGAARKLLEAQAEVAAAQSIYGEENVVGIFLDVSEQEVRRRLSLRLICSKCRRPLMPDEAKEGDPCPDVECGGTVIKRPMDDSDVVDTRMKEFEKHTAPVVDYFREEGLLIVIPAEASPEDVSKDVIAAIDSLMRQ